MSAPAPASRRVAELDGLRGVAIALVLWHHLAERALPAGPHSWLGWLRAATNLSWSGVDLFFVLSGFFIGGILLDNRGSPRLTRTFYLRRAARILPLYYLTLAAIFLVIAAGARGAYQEFPGWSYALFLTNVTLAAANTWDWMPLSVLWSLAVEEQFYLVAPWIVRILPPRGVPWFAAGIVLSVWSARALLVAFFPDERLAGYVLTPLRADGLALGVMLAWAVRNAAARPFLAWLERTRILLLAVALAAVGSLTVLNAATGTLAATLVSYTVLALVFTLLVAIVVTAQPPALIALFALRPLAHLGRLSYCVYLWHALLGVAVVRWLGGEHFLLQSLSSLGVVLLAVGATWTSAAVSWKFFESPLIAWGQRQTY